MVEIQGGLTVVKLLWPPVAFKVLCELYLIIQWRVSAIASYTCAVHLIFLKSYTA